MKKKVTTTLLVGSLIGLSACGRTSPSFDSSSLSPEPISGIINGDTVSSHDVVAQSTVLLEQKIISGGRTQRIGCTATLIAPNLALTAAHCTTVNPKNMSLIFGSGKSAVVRHVLGGVITETFANLNFAMPASVPSKNWGDLAVIKFEGTGLPAGFRIASLLTENLLQDGMSLTIAGYGYNALQKFEVISVGIGAGVLRKANLVMADSQFSETEFLLSETEGRSACRGDSGGPAYLFSSNGIILVGVTSRADSNQAAANCNGGTIYTSVLAQKEFISYAVQFLLSAAFVPGSEIPQPFGH